MQVGQVISGKYRLVRLLGDGGMGSVYEAHHEMLGTRVAIKMLHHELSTRAGLADRFLQEARVAAQIRSAHVVQVTDIDRTPDGVAYIVMELLEGEPLSTVLDRDGRLPVATSCEYTRQILEALEAAHALNVIHRDLKPENVFVTFVAGKPILKLIDFGIAKLRGAQKNLTVAGVLMGTAEYMAPEQAFSADKADARSDLYSVGVMLYEMIAGQRPVSGEDARVIAMKVERGEITPLVHVFPDVPREIAGLVHRAMAARPEIRFQTAAEMRMALEGALSGKRPPTAPLPKTPEPALAALAAPAGTGTVMGAPAEALLTNGNSPQTAMGPGNTARVAPVPAWVGTPPPPDDAPRPRKRSRAPLVALLSVIGVVAVGAIVASQYDVFGGTSNNPTPEPLTFTATPTTPVTTTAAQPTKPATTDTVAPLVQPPVRPTGPTPPRPHPSGSTAPSGSGSAIPPMPTFPPFPSGLPSVLPFPIPSTSTGPVFTVPTVLPSNLPFPIPGLGPTAPTPSASIAPSSTAGY
jgi:serine/threonine-protein kinase